MFFSVARDAIEPRKGDEKRFSQIALSQIASLEPTLNQLAFDAPGCRFNEIFAKFVENAFLAVAFTAVDIFGIRHAFSIKT